MLKICFLISVTFYCMTCFEGRTVHDVFRYKGSKRLGLVKYISMLDKML